MSAEIVNLRRARKAKQRVAHADTGAENRAKHGRTRAERDGQALEADRSTRALDGHRLGAADDGG